MKLFSEIQNDYLVEAKYQTFNIVEAKETIKNDL